MPDPLIFTVDNALAPATCKAMIKQFDRDQNKQAGITLGGLDPSVKKSIDLRISSSPAWQKIDEILCDSLRDCWKKYLVHLDECGSRLRLHQSFKDTGYLMKKYEKRLGYFDWHEDSHIYPELGQHRAFTFIWYLNTVLKGGETSFENCSTAAVQGRFLIFPATFTYMHKGEMPQSSNKYVCSGFLLWPNT